MINLREFKHKPNTFADRLSFFAIVDKSGTILCKDGSLMRCFKFRGIDLESSTENELIRNSFIINNAIKRLESSWAIYVDVHRKYSDSYSTGESPCKAYELLSSERKRQFKKGKNHYYSSYYLSFVFLPPADSQKKLSDFFIEQDSKIKKDKKKENESVLESIKDADKSRHKEFSDLVDYFNTIVNSTVDLIKNAVVFIKPLDSEKTITYLHSCISTKDHQVMIPKHFSYLDCQLTDSVLLGGFEPKLDDYHLAVISIKGFPFEAYPGILDDLNKLSIEYKWTTRFIFSDKITAEKHLVSIQRKWFQKRKRLTQVLIEAISKSESVIVDENAVEKSYDASRAKKEVAANLVNFGIFNTNIILMDKNKQSLENKIKLVESTINNKGFVTFKESINTIEAFIGSVPGCCYANVRAPIINSLNLSHLLPLSTPWTGENKNEYLNGPPLFYATGTGNLSFGFNHFIGDVGHSLLFGPTGAGKSVLLALWAISFLKYKNAKVYIFDKDRSSRVPTYACNGDFYDIADGGLSFMPLQNIDKEDELIWANQFLLNILAMKSKQTTELENEIWRTLKVLGQSPKNVRTMTGFVNLLQNSHLRDIFSQYTLDGPYKLLDSDFDNLSFSNWQAFECGALMESKDEFPHVFNYICHRIEKNLDGISPTLIIIDEGGMQLKHDIFKQQLWEWLKTIRKKKGAVVFATQDIVDVVKANLFETMLTACPTRIFLPDVNAKTPNMDSYYKAFSFNDRQKDLLFNAQAKQDYYMVSPKGRCLFQLGLGKIGQALCCSTSTEDQNLVDKILQEYGKENFLDEFLKLKKTSTTPDIKELNKIYDKYGVNFLSNYFSKFKI